MGDFVGVAKTPDIPSGSMRTLHVKGKKIAVANIEGEFFAIDDRCSHEECSLGTEGFLEEGVVVCGCHGAQFDITSGAVLSLPATSPVASYQVKVENETILVQIPD